MSTWAASRRYLTTEDLDDIPEPSWLIDGVLPQGGLSVLYGPPGVGKTFVALSMALCAATGVSWQERPVQRTPVLYIAAEGLRGMKLRVPAWCESVGKSFPLQPHAFRTLGQPVNFGDPSEVAEVAGDLMGLPMPPKLVVIDTLARCTVGVEENNASGMGPVVEGIDRLCQSLGATALVIHHTGKTGDSPRGSGALEAASEAMMFLSRSNGGKLTLSCPRMKEADQFSPVQLRLERAAESLAVAFAAAPTHSDEAPSGIEAEVLAWVRLNPGQTGTEIGRGIKRGKDGTPKAIKALLASGILELRVGRNGRKQHFVPADDRRGLPAGKPSAERGASGNACLGLPEIADYTGGNASPAGPGKVGEEPGPRLLPPLPPPLKGGEAGEATQVVAGGVS